VDESVTIATLPNNTVVAAKEMLATIKVIPFASPGRVLQVVEALARSRNSGGIAVHPFQSLSVGLVLTELPGIKESVMEGAVEATAARVTGLLGTMLPVERVRHEEAPIADALTRLRKAGANLLLVAGASAVVDRRDVGPAGIIRAGGVIEHFGMPVDPGNLLLIASVGDVPVLGAPGCARSPKENGFDWVLMRLLAGLKVKRSDLTGMGVGGLLMEIVTRPQPRVPLETEGNRNVAAIVLAAGRSTRMGGPNKLLAELNGKPLVRIVAEQALASQASPVIVVTGHQQMDVQHALAGLDVRFVHNGEFAAGLATSVRTGIAAIPPDADGAVVCLGDMPLIEARLIDRLIEAFRPDRGGLIAIPVNDGRRGNPVLWSRRFFGELMTLDGDIGARHLIGRHGEAVVEVPVSGQAAFLDIDTPEALASARIA